MLPPAVATEDIYITLGSPWVPADIIDEFIKYLFGEAVNPYKDGYFMYEQRKEALKCRHDEITGIWEIPEKSRFTNLLLVSRTYGTFRKGHCRSSKTRSTAKLLRSQTRSTVLQTKAV